MTRNEPERHPWTVASGHLRWAASSNNSIPRKEYSDASVHIWVEGYDGSIDWHCRDPGNLTLNTRRMFDRYLAASTNNMIMTHGASQILIEQRYFDSVKELLHVRYPQCLELIESRHPGSKEYIKPMRGGPPPVRQYLTPPIKKPEAPPQGWSLGVDIGNTRIKTALLYKRRIVDLSEEDSQIKTFSGSPNEYFERIEALAHSAREKAEGLGGRLTSLGIAWFGDALNGQPLTQAADLRKWETGRWNKELRQIPDRLKKLNLSVHFFGDSEALGKYFEKLETRKDAYILILGTSTGGAHISSAGNLSKGVHLVSRTIVDLSDEAPRHTATQAPGVLQQYSGSYGFSRALRKECRPTTGDDMNATSSLLNAYLHGDDIRELERARRSIQEVAHWLACSVVDLTTHYSIQELFLSGGFTDGALGDELSQLLEAELKEHWSWEIPTRKTAVVTGWPPSHEVALATAHLASVEARQANHLKDTAS